MNDVKEKLVPLKNTVDSALEAGRALAQVARPGLVEDARPYAILRDASGAERIEYVDGCFEVKDRKRGTVKLKDAESFLSYWGRHQDDSQIYATLDPAQFLAVFNDHRRDTPGWRDHRALYTLAYSREWKAWEERNRKKFDGNVAFAEWLEDQAPDIVQPSGAEMLELALNFRVGEQIAFSNPVHLQSGQTELSYTKIVDASSRGTAGKLAIPDHFRISIPIFDGPTAGRHEFEARFRFRLRDNALSIWYELIRPHKIIERAFREIWLQIEQAAGVPVLFGTPD